MTLPLHQRRRALPGLVAIVLVTLATLVASTTTAGLARAADAPAGQTGIVRGTVVDGDSQEPLPFASIIVKGTTRGAPSRDDGSFGIRGVATGSQALLVTYVGYSPMEFPVLIHAGEVTTVRIELSRSVGSVEEVKVFGDRPLVDVRETSSLKTLSTQDIDDLTIEPTLESLLGQQAGVSVQDGEIHIRGGRSDETALIVDGVSLKDAVSGAAVAGALSAGSAAEVSVAKGGWSSKHGDAISGVVDVRVREGTEQWKGSVSYTTDAMVGTQSLHYANLQLSGPNVLLKPFSALFGIDRSQPATFHLDLSTELSDTYLPSVRDLGPGRRRLKSSYVNTLLGKDLDFGDFFTPRGSNDWRLTAKTGWTVHPAHKLTATYIKSLGFSSQFQAVDIGEVNQNITQYPWAWSHRLDDHYTISTDFYALSLQWKHSLGDTKYHQLRTKYRFSATHQDVRGLNWADYEEPSDEILDDDHPYFVDSGTAPQYHDRYSELAGIDWDFVSNGEHHDVEFGVSAGYEDVQYFSLDAYSVTQDAPLGDEYDLFRVFPAKGSFYVDDKIEYPGIVMRVGVRGDVFFPGERVERLFDAADRPGFNEATRAEWYDATNEIFGRRYKIRFSPSLGISHPITDRSNFFFNYGRFTKWPTYFYMYAATGGISSPEFANIGNPNLDPQISAQYEFGVGHRLSDRLSLRAQVFFKDIYDYPTSVPVELGTRETRRQTFFVYRNADYGRSRGIEIEVQRRRERYAWYSASYSFSVASGKSSDPNALNVVQSLGGDARETDLEEQFLWWHRPHKLTLSGGYQVDADQRAPKLFGWRLPREWKLSFFWLLQSGEAYTPTTPLGTRIDKSYSRNGPIDSVFDLNVVKTFRVGDRPFQLTFSARNLFNHRTVLEIDSATGDSPRSGLGSNWRPAESPQELVAVGYTVRETDTLYEELAGLNDAIVRSMTGLLNPAYIAAPRSLRVGIGYEW